LEAGKKSKLGGFALKTVEIVAQNGKINRLRGWKKLRYRDFAVKIASVRWIF
jgi:hypothetical protein